MQQSGRLYQQVKRKFGEKDTIKFRQLELERLDKILAILEPKVNEGNVAAIDRTLRIAKQRSELLGLDSPVKTEVSETITFVAPEIGKKE